MHLIKASGIPARRGQQYEGSSDSPDVIAGGILSGVHIEVKRVQAGNLYNWLAQSKTDADITKLAMVAHKRNGKQWVAIMDFSEFLVLMARAVPQ